MPRPLRLALVLLILTLPGAGMLRGDLLQPQSEIPLGAGAGCADPRPEVTSLPGGGFVAVWTAPLFPGSLDYVGVFTRFFDSAGQPLGPAIAVSQQGSLYPKAGHVTVAASPEGTVLFAWTYDEVKVVTRLFDATGAPRGNEVLLPAAFPAAALAALAQDGGFTLLMGSGDQVYRWRLNASGLSLGNPALLFAYNVTYAGGGGAAILSLDVASRGSSGLALALGAQDYTLGRILPHADALFTPEINGFGDWAELGPRPAIGVSPTGTSLLAWKGPQVSKDGKVLAQLLDEGGTPLGETFVVDSTWPSTGDGLDIAVDSDGNFLVIWRSGALRARRISPQGVFLGPSWTITSPHDGPWAPAAAFDGQDRLAVAWADGKAPRPSETCVAADVFLQILDGSPLHLPLQGDRFQVTVRWTDHAGNIGDGRAAPLSDDSGYFWFFGPQNVELLVKVLDGRAVNGNFWVFYGSLSDVAYTLTVTDTLAGATKTYTNPAGQLASRADTSAFSGAPPAEAAAAPVTFAAVAPAAAPSLPGPCEDPQLVNVHRPGLCLGGHFEVEVSWREPGSGATGAGEGVFLTDDSGYLWFFGENNAELIVKVLDGRAVNGHFWVFYGALSDVEYTILVRDTATGAERTYHNPAGQLASRADTAAF